MLITHLIIRNFKGLNLYGNDNVDAYHGKAFLIDKNGTYKTTILQAITFMLCVKKDLHNKLINAQNVNNDHKSFIQLELKHNDQVTSFKYDQDTFYINRVAYKLTDYRKQLRHLFNVDNSYLISLISANYFKTLLPSEQLKIFIYFLYGDDEQANTKLEQWFKNHNASSQLLTTLHLNKFDLDKVKKDINTTLKQLQQEVTCANSYNKDTVTLTNDIEQIYNNLQLIESAQLAILVKLNKLIKQTDFNFNVSFTKENKSAIAEKSFIISYLGVEFKNLNNAQQLLISIQIAKFLQSLKGLNLPVLVDNAEALDRDNVKQIFKNHQGQFLLAQVEQSAFY